MTQGWANSTDLTTTTANRLRASGWVSRRARRRTMLTVAGVAIVVMLAFFVMVLVAGCSQ